jgi:hypothetical protein
MGLFGALVKTFVNVATLPVAVVKDTACAFGDIVDGGDPGQRTKAKLQQIKDDVDDG